MHGLGYTPWKVKKKEKKKKMEEKKEEKRKEKKKEKKKEKEKEKEKEMMLGGEEMESFRLLWMKIEVNPPNKVRQTQEFLK